MNPRFRPYEDDDPINRSIINHRSLAVRLLSFRAFAVCIRSTRKYRTQTRDSGTLVVVWGASEGLMSTSSTCNYSILSILTHNDSPLQTAAVRSAGKRIRYASVRVAWDQEEVAMRGGRCRAHIHTLTVCANKHHNKKPSFHLNDYNVA